MDPFERESLDEEEEEKEEETVIQVPEEFALFSLGFTIDAGGSVTKVLFRSKEDYANGRRIGQAEPGEGVLRMRHFASDDVDGLIRFLRDRCDVMESARNATTEADAWFQTGVRTQWFMEQLDALVGTNVKTKLLSEVDGFCKGLFRFYPRIRNRRQPKISPSAVESVLKTSRSFLKMMEKMKSMGDENFADGFLGGGDPAAVEKYVGKLMTTDAETFAKELSHHEIQFPALCVICGSASAMFLIKDDGKYQPGNFSGLSGKTFLALGKQLCGAKDFEDLIDMASRGDHFKVDTLTEDLRLDNRDDDDWYNVMPDSFVIFSLGKMAEEKHRGTYTKEDMATGVLHLVISSIAKLVTTTARLLKAKSVVMTGSLLNRQVAREAMQRWILQDVLTLPLTGEDEIRCIFVDHPGFLCVFGTWFHNWEREQEREKRKKEKQK